jgi:hypothetical protein
MAAETLHLEVNAKVAAGALLVSYALANRGNETVVTYDGALGTGGGDYPDLTGQCYVSYGGPGVARILRIRPPNHPTKDTTKISIPPASEVRPGETRRVQFRLPLPLKERSEFMSGAAYTPQPVGTLELKIGYFVKTPATVLEPFKAPNVWRVVKGASLAETHEVAARVQVTFELLARTDPKFIRM